MKKQENYTKEYKEIAEKCIKYFLEEYKDYNFYYNYASDYITPLFDCWMPDILFYVEALAVTGLAFRITPYKDTYIRVDGMLEFKGIYYILVDLNNFDDFVRITDKHFK